MPYTRVWRRVRVLQCFEDQPSTSTQAVAHTIGVHHMSVWQVMHCYHLQKLQAKTKDDLLFMSPFVDGYSDKLCRYLTSCALYCFLMGVPLPEKACITPGTAIYRWKKSSCAAYSKPPTSKVFKESRRSARQGGKLFFYPLLCQLLVVVHKYTNLCWVVCIFTFL